MTSSSPPVDPALVTRRLRSHLNKLEAHLKVQALRREHSSEREQLAVATRELKAWNAEQRAKRGAS